MKNKDRMYSDANSQDLPKRTKHGEKKKGKKKKARRPPIDRSASFPRPRTHGKKKEKNGISSTFGTRAIDYTWVRVRTNATLQAFASTSKERQSVERTERLFHIV